ncbi:acyl-CoA dehydrogenase family protein [Cupriavidus basilensis]
MAKPARARQPGRAAGHAATLPGSGGPHRQLAAGQPHPAATASAPMPMRARLASATDSNLLKLNITDNAIAAVELAVRLAGNPALSRGNPLERHYRNVLCSRIHTPQNDAILVSAGEQALRAAAHAYPPGTNA